MDTYPDMNAEGWNVTDVEAFAAEYNLNVSIQYQETTQYEEGMVISQSRAVGSQIYKGTSLRIVVAKKPEEKKPETNTDKDKETTNNNDSSNNSGTSDNNSGTSTENNQ